MPKGATKAKPSPKWGNLLKELSPELPSNPPRVTVLLPTLDCAHTVAITLNSILDQDYPDIEVIAIDRNSSDRTVAILKGYRDPRLRIYSVAHDNLYEALNWGISLAHGEYVNILFPGDFYLSPLSTQIAMEVALREEEPDLVYAAAMIRIRKQDPQVLFRPFNYRHLRKGQQPTALESCWIRQETLLKLGKFPARFHRRGGFDLLCRLRTKRKLRHAHTPRVLTDHLPRTLSYKEIFGHFTETAQVIYRYFGFATTVRWLCLQRDIYRGLSRWWRGVKAAFIPGRGPSF